ncbi:MAG TPA: ATP-binding protein [Thermoanaerobaculales bacterium]|nr:ATP-binding protein [Thermoanaerobaculales bacterium]HPA81018.1 ATP-binding protein [Thermoanaerobaculales bacterium]HQL31057.1 ATP-binding protein [Thermoanaerobaculales bacterium]HQN96575.1 ATP-binding protein [Thermoanaerobaculales bacterium]
MSALSRLPVRLLAFNILLVFLPAAGILFLDTYERHLLDAQERTMAQEGRLLAAALEASGGLDAGHARAILVELGQRQLARLRVVDGTGAVLADSALLGPRRPPAEPSESPAAAPPVPPQRRLLYLIGSLPFRLLRGGGGLPEEAREPLDAQTGILSGSEVQAALAGRYGAATRVLGDAARTVMLHIAIPVRVDSEVVGAVVVSQSTVRIMATLYAVRLDVFRVFLASLAVAVVLTLIVATTIARPLARLRLRAGEILDRRGRLTGGFEPSRRRDEIGELERALAELTRRLEEHLRHTESFAADVSHEFRNPLASIRTATEMALEVEDPAQRRRFLEMAQRDVARMERLLREAREISRIDAHLDEEERSPVALGPLLGGLVESFRLRSGATGPRVELAAGGDAGLTVLGSADRLTQVFENLLANAASFSPPGGAVVVGLHASGGQAEVVVADEGPGIPEEHRDRIFTRFFSWRPQGQEGAGHTGLGLAIVRAIVEGYGGQVSYRPRRPRGTEFVVTLPLAAR